MKTMQRFLFRAWRPALLLVSLGSLAYLLYFHQLGSLLPGYAAEEHSSYTAASNWHDIVGNPLNAPYKVTLFILSTISHQGLLLTRVSAALWGVAAVIIFYCIARSWYGFRVAFLSTAIFATSGGFLHFARLGTPAILQMGLLLLLGLTIWHRRAPRLHPYLTYVVVTTFSLLLYIPGMIWFEALLLVLMYTRIVRHWNRSANVHQILWPLLAAALLLPLGWSIMKHTNLLLPLLGFSDSLHSLTHVGGNLWHTLLTIGIQSTANPLLWLGRSPLLNATELILGALGAYYYLYQQRSARSLLLAGIAVIGIVLISLGGNITIACIIPVLYLIIASGLNHFLDRWLTVFPRNPIARGTGTLIICIMLFFSSFYHVRAYFVAWPHNPATKQTFRLSSSP
jgi:hypothetical protein